ncbi:MAG: TonB-dependent receptor [Candidatus Marinimicrobia bacterium]|nr:TonB-dependent receptor [Candidatus Neomarinimicrobiota bacterium]
MKKNLLIILGIIILSSMLLFSASTGKIAGTVTDAETGEPLSGVNIVVEGEGLGAASDMEGYFSIINIPPGRYTIVATMIGYAKFRLTNVRVNIDLTTSIKIEMQREDIKGEEIVVRAQRKIVKEDVSSSQVNVAADEIEDLPVHSVESAIGMRAGVSGLNIRNAGQSGTEDEVALIMDGISLKDERTQQPITGIPLSSVQEVMVQSGGFNAEYSNLQAGVINVVTKEGSPEKYTFNMNFRYRPPAPKHFGKSVYSPESYYMRPWLDDEVAWNGTKSEPFTDQNGNDQYDKGEPFEDLNNDGSHYTSPWGDYMQEKYPDFQGWNNVAQDKLDNDDPTDDLTPAAAKRLFEWQHRRDGNITEPDWNVDMGIGGPFPFPSLSKKLGNLRFYSSFRSEKTMYIVPLKRDAYSNWSMSNRFTSNITDNIKLKLRNFIKEDNTVSESETGNPYYVYGGIYDVANNFDGDSQQRSKIFYPDYYCASDISNYLYSAKLIHTLTQNTYYEVSGEYSSTNYLTGPGDVRNTEPKYDILPGADSEYLASEAPYGFETSLSSESIDGFMMGAKSNARDSTKTKHLKGRFDIVSQVNKNNQIKSGLVFDYYDYHMNYGAVNPELPVGRPWTEWQENPFQIGAYIQDKLEFEGWVATIGLRAEYFDPNTQKFAVDAYNKALFSSNYKPSNLDDISKEEAKGLFTLLPRLGISHPITENSKLYFNYGHMRQKFSPDQLFGVERVTSGQMSEYGNPELPMEKTIQYELGYDHSLFDKYLLHLSGYYKDKTDQASRVYYTSADNTVDYSRWSNIFYQDVRGFEAELRKTRGDWLTGFINYTYAVYSSGRFGLQYQYQNPTLQRQYEENTSAQEQYKPIPQPRANFNISFHSPSYQNESKLNQLLFSKWDLSLTGHWSAGGYATYGNVYGVTNNVRWKDNYNVDLKMAKTMKFDKLRLTFIAEVFNLFNFKHLSMAGLGDPYLTPEIRTKYENSLHFKKKVYEELGEKYIYGDDKLGDYRPLDVPYQPMDYVNRIDNNFQGQSEYIYKIDQISTDMLSSGIDLNNYNVTDGVITDFNEFVQLNEEGKYEIVKGSRINQVLDDKAYIFNPVNESFMFLNPRDVFLGIKISYEL